MTYLLKLDFDSIDGFPRRNPIWTSLYNSYRAEYCTSAHDFRVDAFQKYVCDTYNCKLESDSKFVTGLIFDSKTDYLLFLLKV